MIQPRTKELEFINHEGLELSACLDLPPDRKPKAFGIFAHCFTCNKNFIAAKYISRALASKGWGILRFDLTGHGKSQGEFVQTGIDTNLTDILAAAKFLSENYEAPSLIVGHSLGGVAAIMAALNLPSIKAVATIGSPSEAKHVVHLFHHKLDEILHEGEAEVHIGGRKFLLGRRFVDEAMNADLLSDLKKLNKAILFLHAPNDQVVSVEHARLLYQAAKHPKSFVSLDSADHVLSAKEDARYAGELIATWAERYTLSEKEDLPETDLEVVAQIDEDDLFTTRIKAGNHYLTADEPQTVGGDDFGPSPYQLLSSSLGACTAMTLKMYARRKNWNLGQVEVHCQHNKQYIEDQEGTINQGATTRQMDVIERVLEFSASLSVEQKDRLLQIANRCPVHRTLEHSVLVKTRIRE